MVLVGASCSKTFTTNTNATTNKNTAVANKNVNAKTNTNTSNVNAANVNTTNVNVAEEATSITIDKTVYAIGEDITVTYNIIETLKDGAWVGIVPTDTEHGLESDGDAADVDWQYLDGSTSGTMTFTAPDEAGDYDIRAYDTEFEGGVELGDYASFTVTE